MKFKSLMFYPLAAIIRAIECTFISRWLPDSIILKSGFLLRTKEWLDLKNPQNFNQKIQWLKLYDRKPLYTVLSDKYAVREYISEKIGEQYLIPLLWVGERFDDINFDALPDQFVIKNNHDCGSVVICKDKNDFDHKFAQKKIKKKLKKSFYCNRPGRQWQYKDIPKKIIIEKYIANDSSGTLSDYKIFCFDGKPRLIAVYSERHQGRGTKTSVFDVQWNIIPFITKKKLTRHTDIPQKPESLDEMLHLSRVLSKDIPFVRVDFYLLNDSVILFGELTFTPNNGICRFDPPEWNKTLGDWLKLPER